MSNFRSNGNDSIGYKGDVVVKILKGDKVYKEKTFHNSGRWPMFQHLAYALSGEYSNSDRLRPLVLGLFSVPKERTPGGEGKIPNIADNTNTWDKDDTRWQDTSENSIKRYASKDTIAIANPAMLLERPQITVDRNAGIGKTSIKYKFLIPINQLRVDESINANGWNHDGYKISPINLVGIYSRDNQWWITDDTQTFVSAETYGNPNAFFFVPDEEDSSILGSLLPKSWTANVGEYSISIEWTLNIQSQASSFVPIDLCAVEWVDNIGGQSTVEQNYGYNELPKEPFTPEPQVTLNNNQYYLFAGWYPQIDLTKEERTTYTTSYWYIKVEGSELIISPTPVTQPQN